MNDKYKDIIIGTKPIKINKGPFETHMLLSSEHLIRGMYALKSYYLFQEKNSELVLHDDGTLKPEDKNLLKEHFIGCKIIDKKVADLEILPILPKLSRDWRRRHISPLMAFDYGRLSNSSYIVGIDSDILFFGKSLVLESYTEKGSNFYTGGGTGREEYSFSPSFLRSKGIDTAGNLNSGIIGFSTSLVDKIVESAEKLLTLAEEKSDFWVMEQTVYACLFAKIKSEVLWAGVDVVFNPKRINTSLIKICHHIDDSKYNTFFPVGVEYLLSKTNFLEALK